MTPSAPTPEDLETIAAFIDRRLAPEERAAFLQRLDREEALYDVFVETVRSRDEGIGTESATSEEEDDESNVVPHPAPWRRWALPLAAAATAILAVGVLVNGRAGGSYAESLVADGRFETRLDENWFRPPWSGNRGPADPTGARVAALRYGALQLDLELATLIDQRAEAAYLMSQLRSLSLDLGREEAAAAYERALQQLELGKWQNTSLRSLPSAEVFPEGSSLEPYYLLGRWAEAGRQAAAVANTRFLGSDGFLADLTELRSQPWDDGTGALLKELEGLLSVTPIDHKTTERRFVAIISRS